MTNNYNSRLKPAEVLWYNNESILIRKKEEFNDILNKQIEINFDL
jgi:diaminopimelate decarboxylase